MLFFLQFSGLTGYLEDLFIKETCGVSEYKLRKYNKMQQLTEYSRQGNGWDSLNSEKRDLTPLLYHDSNKIDVIQNKPFESNRYKN